MKFTFGIVTGGDNPQRVQAQIDAVQRLDPNGEWSEVIVVGGADPQRPHVRHIVFDESSGPPMWITRKKNIITDAAAHDRIVYMHDYIVPNDDWYRGFLEFGDDWVACMTRMTNLDGGRYRDWTLDPYAVRVADNACLLPYDVLDLSYYMYFSGAYWVAKKGLMKEFPLDDRLPAGRGEDIIWSRRVNVGHSFSMNASSSVSLLKLQDPVFPPATAETIEKLRKSRPVRFPMREYV